MTTQIHFLLSERLEGYVFNPHRPEGLSFTDEKTGVEIQIRASGGDGDYGYGHRDLKLLAKISCDATESQIGFVETLINERIVRPDETPIKLPYSLNRGEVVTSHGELAEGFSPTSDFLPTELQELCFSTGNELEKHAIRFVKLLRWLENANGPAAVREEKDPRFSLFWKTVQENYHSVPWPRQGSLTLPMAAGLQWTGQNKQGFSELWQGDLKEPLGHQLLREAKGIAEHNCRSALLICYSALEVGLKQHLGACAPEARWLVKWSPSPPISKVLTDYLPEIHARNQNFNNWDETMSPIKKLMNGFTEDRNRLAHRGEQIKGSLDDYLRLTENLLYAFDVFEGHDWAKNHVSKEFAEKLGWEQTNERSVVTLSLEQ